MVLRAALVLVLAAASLAPCVAAEEQGGQSVASPPAPGAASDVAVDMVCDGVRESLTNDVPSGCDDRLIKQRQGGRPRPHIGHMYPCMLTNASSLLRSPPSPPNQMELDDMLAELEDDPECGTPYARFYDRSVQSKPRLPSLHRLRWLSPPSVFVCS